MSKGIKIPEASASQSGVMTTGTQTIAGAKAFTSPLKITNSSIFTGTATSVNDYNSALLVSGAGSSITSAKAFIGLETLGGGGGAGIEFGRGISYDTTMTFKVNATSGTSSGSINVEAGSISSVGAWTLGNSTATNQEHILYGRTRIVGNTGSGQHLEVYRTSNVATAYLTSMLSDVGGTAVLKWRVEADGDTFGGTGGTYTSDLRVKKNVEPIQYGLNEILQLDPMSFNWVYDEEGETKSFTVGSAQKIQQIMPEMVSDDGLEYEIEGEVTKVKAVYGQEIVAVMVKAIQEQQAIINNLTARIEALEAL